MAILSNGKFYGFLCSAKETGQKLANGAKEYVENFVSGFAGHGWKIWEYVKGKWMLEIDSIRVRGQFTVFEMLVSKIRAIIGSQAITQGHAKVKSVIVADCEVHREIKNERYTEDFTELKWEKLAADNLTITQRIITVNGSSKYSPALVVESANYAINSFGFTVTGLKKSIQLTWTDEEGVMQMMEITEDGEYEYPQSYQLVDSPLETQRVGIVINNAEDSLTIKQGISSFEYSDFVTTEPCYNLEIEDETNTISEYDFIKCQKLEKIYHVQVGSISEKYINIPISEFDVDDEGNITNPPEVGDEIVQFGNSSHLEAYIGRHSAIYMHADEGLQPAIDVLDGIYSKDWSDCLKVRMGGDIPGTNGSKGLYCVNGKLLFVDENGGTVSEINPDGSASFAKGKLSWTKDGSPSFSGTILVKTDIDNIWTVNEQCENIIGNPNGKRIIVSPNTQDIRFFDSNDINVISIESSKKTDISTLFNSSSTDIEIINIPFSVSKKNQNTYISNLFETKGLGSLVSSFFGGSSSLKETGSAVTISIVDFEDSAGKVIIGRTTIYGKSQINLKDWSINESNVYAPIREGFHRIELNMFCLDGLISINDFSCRYVSNTYLSSYFSNGLALGTSNENSFVVLNNDEDSIEGLFVNRNAGLKLDKKSLLVKKEGYYGLSSCIISYGQVFIGLSDAIIDKARSFDMFVPTVERIGVGLVKMSFPKHWNVTSSTVYFTLTGIGQAIGASGYDGMLKATLSHWINNLDGTQSAVIALSDDATNNDGTFFYEIKRY